MNVAIIDERSEIAATSHGIAQMDVGRRTDVLDCCPKPEGISMATVSYTHLDVYKRQVSYFDNPFYKIHQL